MGRQKKKNITSQRAPLSKDQQILTVYNQKSPLTQTSHKNAKILSDTQFDLHFSVSESQDYELLLQDQIMTETQILNSYSFYQDSIVSEQQSKQSMDVSTMQS